MYLAAFGCAQIYLAQGDLKRSLDLFEDLHRKHPTDKDTFSFFILVASLIKNDVFKLEELRDAMPGFQFEADVWLLQVDFRLLFAFFAHVFLNFNLGTVETEGSQQTFGIFQMFPSSC